MEQIAGLMSLARARSKPAKFRAFPIKIGHFLIKRHKNQQKPVEIGLFTLTLLGLKPHCFQRQGSPDPHGYRVFEHTLPPLDSPDALNLRQ
jgi:hypothetical protein